MTLRGIVAPLVVGTLMASVAGAEPTARPAITVDAGKYGPYYHLQYDLTASAIDFRRTDRALRSGGQFEVRVRATRFPIAAPKCPRWIIARMPWTAPDAPHAAEKIAAKERLFRRIQALRDEPKGTVPVTLELNPYVTVVERKPLRLRLTQCTVFFRQSGGAYVDTSAAPP